MTNRIYYTDPMCREFAATVVDSFELGGRPAVALDRTAFYPTSGGQPYDTGAIGPRRVIDVIDDDQRIVHVLDEPLPAGTPVDCVIDWPRRFDHMQQHTGQHILSAAFEHVAANPTIGFHLGAEACTIDLAHDVTPTDVERAEADANRIVWDDEPVTIRFASPDEARRLPLRKESLREGTLRLIDIPGFDLSACGGTHVRRTGVIGIIAVSAVERVKGGARVTFVCGGRALRSHRLLRTVVANSIRVLSVAPSDLPAGIERLQAELKEQRKALKEAREALAIHDARALLDSATEIGGVKVVVRSLEGLDAAALKAMAGAMVAHPHVAVALLTSEPPVQLVVARSSDVALDASTLLRNLIARYGGKGGGKPDLAQGGGLSGDVREIVWAASGLLEEGVSGGVPNQPRPTSGP
jgi:alanyl-tRNA synthetase